MTYKTDFVLTVKGGEGGGGQEEEEEEEKEEQQEISFSTKSQSYCVCFISMVDSTESTFIITDSDKIRRYYSIFINTMAAIARSFSAKIIKNTGTSLIYYFPKTSNSNNPSAFRDVIECGITMIAANKVINMKLKEEGLAAMKYKISADYGRVEVARSQSSPNTDDLFGSTMNICAKINSMAPVNGMVIGNDLYYIAKKFSSSSFFGNAIGSGDRSSSAGGGSQYYFEKLGEYSISSSFKYKYPVYSVSAVEGKKHIISDLRGHIPKLQKKPSYFTPPATTTDQANNEEELIQYQQQQQKKKSPATGSTTAATVMIVDDEPDILLTYKTYLTSAGYNVDTFTDPRAALMHFIHTDHNMYNLVVMDIRMPNLNGLQLYYRIKAINPNIKVLFVSALDAAQEMVSILPDIGLHDIIRKPVDIGQFLSKVKTVLK